ncbi:MAG TPA: hypothetical protein VM370_12395 [Candidatus Thermoplasmatota archaeon]|nr:hypothetical protein [Candidatus Thermoplasmatota archaeon]
MHPYVATGAICAILVLAGTALSVAGVSHDAPALDTMEAHVAASGHGHGGGAHPYAGGTGTIPSSSDGLERINNIVIGSDKEFNPENGVRSGSGTFEDPYLISGWSVESVLIHDTSKAFEMKELYVSNIMILDWTGQGGYVHHNHINNLRTNRNVERTGDPSATVIEKNEIAKVEELRHFDGVVANNTIGRPALLDLVDLGDDVVFNIAGLNGAGIHDNMIYGGVDMKIHGHHHSDAEGAHSHNHGEPDAKQAEDHVEDHQVRYVDFLFYHNTIKDNGFGLRYNDLNHAGDDRTATSEQEPDLEKPHTHHTKVTLLDNTIDGATLRIAILNADDERHVGPETAELYLIDNKVLHPSAGDGIVVSDVKNAHVYVTDNKVEKDDRGILGLGVAKGLGGGQTGILLQRFRNSTIHLDGNALGDYKYAIRASQFDADTTWSVGQNSAPGAEYPVYWDDSVPNAPEGDAAPPEDNAHHHSDDAAPTDVVARKGVL